VVHNPALGIEYPPRSDKQFAVVQVDGFQYKVMEDTILILDHKPEHAINQPVKPPSFRSYSKKCLSLGPIAILFLEGLSLEGPQWRASLNLSATPRRS